MENGYTHKPFPNPRSPCDGSRILLALTHAYQDVQAELATVSLPYETEKLCIGMQKSWPVYCTDMFFDLGFQPWLV